MVSTDDEWWVSTRIQAAAYVAAKLAPLSLLLAVLLYFMTTIESLQSILLAPIFLFGNKKRALTFALIIIFFCQIKSLPVFACWLLVCLFIEKVIYEGGPESNRNNTVVGGASIVRIPAARCV